MFLKLAVVLLGFLCLAQARSSWTSKYELKNLEEDLLIRDLLEQQEFRRRKPQCCKTGEIKCTPEEEKKCKPPCCKDDEIKCTPEEEEKCKPPCCKDDEIKCTPEDEEKCKPPCCKDDGCPEEEDIDCGSSEEDTRGTKQSKRLLRYLEKLLEEKEEK